MGKDGQLGEIKFNAAKRTATINLINIDLERFNELEKAIKALLS